MSEDLYNKIKAALEKAGETELLERFENWNREMNEFLADANDDFEELQRYRQIEAWGR